MITERRLVIASCLLAAVVIYCGVIYTITRLQRPVDSTPELVRRTLAVALGRTR